VEEELEVEELEVEELPTKEYFPLTILPKIPP
jgi:hypothetical protein